MIGGDHAQRRRSNRKHAIVESHRVIPQLVIWISQRRNNCIVSDRAGWISGRREDGADSFAVFKPVMVPVNAGFGSPYRRLALAAVTISVAGVTVSVAFVIVTL